VTTLVDKFRRELRSFYALTIMNIAFGGIAMALGINLVTQNIFTLIETQNLLLPELTFLVIGVLSFGIGLRWLLASAEILDGVTDIQDDYDNQKATMNDDTMTHLIVRMTSHYRENKVTIKYLSLFSKIAGVCFLVSGIIIVVNGILVGTTFNDIFTILGTIIYLVFGTCGIIVPYFLKQYSSIWDARLQQSAQAESALDKELEGS
jgi:hypothetical protein